MPKRQIDRYAEQFNIGTVRKAVRELKVSDEISWDEIYSSGEYGVDEIAALNGIEQ